MSGGSSFDERIACGYSDVEYPDDCIVDFDMRLIDLFKELDKKSVSVKKRIKQEFYRVKESLDGKVPARMEPFTYMDKKDILSYYGVLSQKIYRGIEHLDENGVLTQAESRMKMQCTQCKSRHCH